VFATIYLNSICSNVGFVGIKPFTTYSMHGCPLIGNLKYNSIHSYQFLHFYELTKLKPVRHMVRLNVAMSCIGTNISNITADFKLRKC